MPHDPGMGGKKGDHRKLVDDIVSQANFEAAVNAVVSGSDQNGGM
jgi:hypothetical protein